MKTLLGNHQTSLNACAFQRSFEERKRGEFRKKWLSAIHTSARTSGALLEPVFKTVYQALSKDAEVHGRNKKTSAYVAFLEPNQPLQTNHSGSNCLRYISCTPEDAQYILNKVLYRDMKNVSFTVIDAGKPIHVPRVLHNGGVHIWNPSRKEEVCDPCTFAKISWRVGFLLNIIHCVWQCMC